VGDRRATADAPCGGGAGDRGRRACGSRWGVRPLPALAAFVGAALIQVGTNFANDYYDAIQGADTDDREGFTRVVASGLIEPGEVKRAMWLTFAAAILVGTSLVYVGGVPILVIGLASVAAGIAYTGSLPARLPRARGPVRVRLLRRDRRHGHVLRAGRRARGRGVPSVDPRGPSPSRPSSRAFRSPRSRRTSSSSTTSAT